MTKQVPDTVEIDGRLFELHPSPPLWDYSRAPSDSFVFFGLDSSNRKGVFSKWVIVQGALFLVEVEGTVARSHDHELPCDKAGDFTIIGLKELHGTEDPVQASWYTGELRYAEQSRDWDEPAGQVMCLRILAGRVVGRTADPRCMPCQG